MASTDPIGLELAISITVTGASAARPDAELRNDDIRRVRRYARMAAALSSLTLFLLVLLGAWLIGRWGDPPWDGVAGPVIAGVLLAAGRFALAERRLRTYDVALAGGAVTYAYGRRRVYLPIRHLQLIDTESSPLLRPMGLKRCVLHTAGGMVIISPVPVRLVSAMGQAMLAQRGGPPDAT